MRLALAEAEKSLAADEFPVGCVITAHDQVIATGRRLNSAGPTANELDHAEIIAIRNAAPLLPKDDLRAVAVYSTMEPCLMCFATLLLSGIRTVVYGYEDAMGGGTSLPLAQLSTLYRQMEIVVVPHVLRNESLRLFKRFFANPESRYWRGSFLADYTLAQPE